MSAAIRFYRLLLRLLPRSVRDQDGEEIAQAFEQQLTASRQPRAAAWRAYRRFPLLLALEWRDHLTGSSAPSTSRPVKASTMDSIVRLLRQGSRSLIRTPAFALSVVLLLGLGVGSVSAIFAVVDHVLLRPLPYPMADRLFEMQNGSHSVPMFRDFKSMGSVEAWAAVTEDYANLTGAGDPLRVQQATVTDGFFPMFGARAHVGRLLGGDDFRVAQSVVLSYGTWQRVFGGERSVIGQSIRINDEALTVVGVLDPDFAPPETLVGATTDVWRPLDPKAEYIDSRNTWLLSAAGRLKPGATLDDAAREAERIAAERAKTFPKHYAEEDGRPSPLPVVGLQEATTGEVRQGLSLLFGAVTLLLLVACLNVTHLFLARGVTRIREMAVRRAVGANTRALVAQLFAESLVLGLAGALVGVLIAQAGVRAFLAVIPEGLPRALAIRVDARVLLFTAGIGIATAIIFGLLPALRFARGSLGNPLRSASRGVIGGPAAQSIRNAIVVGEVALSLVLIAQAGWLLRSFIRLNNQELGFRTQNVVTMPLSVRGIGDEKAWFVRMEQVRESLAATPGVRQAAYGLTMPLEFTGGNRCCWSSRVQFDGKPQSQRSNVFHPVSEGYFELLRLEFLAGQPWTRERAMTQPYPVVINEKLALQNFGSTRAALGAGVTSGGRRYEVVGVTANNRHYGADQELSTAVYLPANAIPFASGNVHAAVLTDRTDAGLHTDLRAAIWKAEPTLPVPIIRSLPEWSRVASAQQRFDSALFIAFGAITLLLVAGGLAGTLFYMVSLQRRDLGIRLALGETARGLERVVLTRGVGMAAIGAIIGSAGAWASGRFIESRLYGVDARDLRTLGLAMAVLMTIALISSWVPARRAASTNPIESLRAD